MIMSGDVSIEEISGIKIIKLKGSDYDMGRQYGEMSKKYARRLYNFYLGAIDSEIEDLIPKNINPKLREQLKNFLNNILETIVWNNLTKQVPEGLSEILKGFSDAIGVPEKEAIKGLSTPDAYFCFVSYLFGNRPLLKHFFGEYGLTDVQTFKYGCTSIVAWGQSTKKGKMIYGRNLDFWGVDYWDKNPAVIFYQPNDGLAYAALTTFGKITAGTTAINEKGITVAPHITMSKDVSFKGIPTLFVTDTIVRRAETLDDAIQIASELKTAIGVTFVVTDAKNKKVAALEMSARGLSVRRNISDYFVQTNHYITNEMQEREIDFNFSISAHTVGRYRRAKELIQKNYGKITEQKMAKFLGDHKDYFLERERPLGNIITHPTNLTSVVFVPEDMKFWMANGRAPVSHSGFIGIDFNAEIGKRKKKKLKTYKGTDYKDKPEFEGLKHHIRALREKEKGSLENTIEHLKIAAEKDSKETSYLSMRGLFEMKNKNYENALECFNKAIALNNDTPYKKQAFILWQGLAYDLMHEREKALESYYKLERQDGLDSRLTRQVEKLIKKPYTESESSRMIIDFLLLDVMRY